MSEQYGCPDCNYVEYIDKIPIQCPKCGHTSMEHLRWTKGGDGSHWEGCEEVHWDCRIAQLEKEIARLNDIIARLKEDGERLAERPHPFTYVEHIERGTYCHYCHKSYKFEHDDNCPITLHRALMKELK